MEIPSVQRYPLGLPPIAQSDFFLESFMTNRELMCSKSNDWPSTWPPPGFVLSCHLTMLGVINMLLVLKVAYCVAVPKNPLLMNFKLITCSKYDLQI